MTTSEKRIGNLYGATGGNFAGTVYDSNEMCPTLNSMGGGGRMPHIITSVITNTGKTHQGNEVFDKCAASPTIRAEAHGNTPVVIAVNNLHIAHNCGNALAMNCHEDGTSRTIKAQCARTSTANYLRTDSFGAGGGNHN